MRRGNRVHAGLRVRLCVSKSVNVTHHVSEPRKEAARPRQQTQSSAWLCESAACPRRVPATRGGHLGKEQLGKPTSHITRHGESLDAPVCGAGVHSARFPSVLHRRSWLCTKTRGGSRGCPDGGRGIKRSSSSVTRLCRTFENRTDKHGGRIQG